MINIQKTSNYQLTLCQKIILNTKNNAIQRIFKFIPI